MEQADFLRRVLPSDGIYYGSFITNGTFKQHPIPDIPTLEKYIAKVNDGKRDVYFATATFNSQSRTQAQVARKKAFYLDIDTGPTKPYESLGAAAAALAAYLKAANLPKPSIIVNSGHGMHVYWTLDKSISSDQWKPIASALTASCHEHGLEADHSVTADSARILRVPGTLNVKDPNHPLECKVIGVNGNIDLKVFRNSLGRWLGPQINVNKEMNNDLSGGMTFREKYAKNIIEQCPIFAEIYETGGKDCIEPEWRAALATMYFCADGEDYIHDLSKGHDEYSYNATVRKYEKGIETITAAGSGPHTCETWHKLYHNDHCSTCPHNGKINSPAVLGFESDAEPDTPPDEYPRGFYEYKNKIFFKLDDDSDAMLIANLAMHDVKLLSAPDGLILNFTAVTDSEEIPAFVPLDRLARYTDLYTTLVKQRVVIPNIPIVRNVNMATLIRTWTEKLQAAGNTVRAHTAFGWTSEQGRMGFACGEDIYWSDGTLGHTWIYDKGFIDDYIPVGDLEAWKKVANAFIAENRTELDCVLASSFAAPLMYYTNVEGAVMSLISSESGTGKSTALALAASVWGNAKSNVAIINDTQNAIMKQVGMTRHLPNYYDEAQHHSQNSRRSFVDMVFQLAQGREKSRLHQDASRNAGGDWRTLFLVASNYSIVGTMVDAGESTTNADRFRLLELETEMHPFAGSISALTEAVRYHYGHAGRVYAEYLAKNHEKVRHIVRDAIEYYEKDLKSTQDERFWVATIAVLLVGATLAKGLGLVDFNVQHLKGYLKRAFMEQRLSVRETHRDIKTHASTALQEFLNIHTPQSYAFEDMDTKGNPVGAQLREPDRHPIAYEYGAASNRVKIEMQVFTKWMRDNGFKAYEVMKKSKGRRVQSAVGSSSDGSFGKKVRVIVVDL